MTDTKEDLAQKLFGVANPPDNKKYDFSHVEPWMGRSEHGFGLDWQAKGVGFGQVYFEIGPDGQMHIDTENTSDEFITELLAYMVTKATKDDQQKDWKTTTDYWREGFNDDLGVCPYTNPLAAKYWTRGYEAKQTEKDYCE